MHASRLTLVFAVAFMLLARTESARALPMLEKSVALPATFNDIITKYPDSKNTAFLSTGRSV